jgi:dolichol-phosphate mannosyltransferase
MNSILFIPVYNEIHRLPLVLDELRSHELPVDAVLFVNNGSHDGSEVLVRESGYEVIDLPENRGVGYAHIRALDWALERGYRVFGSLAGNGKMLAGELHRVFEPVLSGRADYVTGSRFLPGGASPNLPAFRRYSIRLVNAYVRALTGRRVTDATCGYRAYRLEILRRALFDWHADWLHSYGFEYYLYAKVMMSGQFRHVEVPVTMRYPPKGIPYSKIPRFVGWYAMLKPWMKARLDGQGFAPRRPEGAETRGECPSRPDSERQGPPERRGAGLVEGPG